MHHITEDTPPDMLAGAMDLAVHLPDGRDVNMAVERGTPMMDLLVQVTTAYKLRPSDYIIQPLDMSERERALPYKPNTPIGALDTQRIRVLPKGRPAAPRVPPPPGHQPFESTFRLQVHLPRNQFIVIRVGKFVMLEDIMKKVCEEKNLDPRKYEFRHPANIDKVLDPKRTLNDYEITEITVVARGASSHMSQTISSSDIMALQREEERRKLQAKTGGGVLNLIFRRGRTSMGSGSVSSDTRSISPTQSDDSRSVTPPAVPPILPVPQEVPTHPVSRPKPPQRKRRPAPKPPSQAPSEVPSPAEKCQQEPASKLENGLTICHSRNSSDSSGYHEASILSDHCTTLPRRPKATVINTSLTNSTLSVERMEMSTSTGNLTNMAVQSKSTMSLANAGRKKKAPPPPPALKSASSVANISTSIPVVASSNEPTPKVHSDNSSPAMSNDSRPMPKPRLRTPMPVPTPRKIFIEDNLSLPVTINNQNPANIYSSVPNSLDYITDESDDILSQTENSEANTDSESNYKISRNNSTNSLVSTNSNKSKISREIGKEMNNLQELSTFNNSSQNISENNLGMYKSPLQNQTLEDNSGTPEELSRTLSYLNENDDLHHDDSMLSLRSVKSIPGFMGNDTNIKKWDKMQNLDEDSDSLESSHQWVVGDSDAESACPATPSDLRSLPRTSDASINTTSLASFAQDSSNNQPSSRSSLTSSENPISELSSNSLPNFTSTPTRKENGVASQSFGESRIVSEPERKKSIIEIERKLTTIEPERKQSLPKVESERKTSLPKEVMKNDSERKSNFSKENVKEERKQSLIKDPERKQSLTKEVMKMVPDRKDSLSKETIEEKRKHSFIKELEGKQSLTKEITEPERKQSLPKEVMKMVPEIKDSFPNVEEERKQSLTREPERKQSLVKEEQLEDNLIQKKEIDIRKNLTDAQKLDPIKITNNEQDDLETDWQYTLPSPPKAFRDSSPTNFTDMTNYDTVTFNGLPTDSVVTDPTLFEKLEHIKDRSETETIISEESTSSKPEVTKYLNLENLEKRKSLVLERELASLKNAQNKNTEETIRTQRDNLKNEIEEVIKNKTLSRSNSQSRDKILATDSTLPNFKITTYDQPKNKLNIYEDDTVRSNVENNSKRNSLDLDKQSDNDNFLRKRNTSTENMFFAKRNSVDDAIFKKPEMPKYKRQVSITNLNDVSRSESFSTKNSIWERSNPVKRSKSHISLDKYKDESKKVDSSEEGLHKSSSLFNVSGLQSLEVMRLILPKLGNTPPSTPSEDLKPEPLKLSQQKEKPFSPKNLTKTSTPKQQEEETKKYQYSGPPAINLGTWSERPKSQVSIKEDQDYKISKIDAIKNKFSQKEKNFSSVNIRVNEVDSGTKLNIKVNDSKTISHQSSGNVIIKIEPEKPENKPQKNNFYSRFLNQTTAVGYRKPLGNINGVDKPRPHSIAFDANCPDLSRVPIVRAVELKKPYKDTNKSVTQIVPENNLTKNNSSVYLSSENLNKPESNILSLFSKPITRGNSFASNRAPTVKGFRMPSNETEIETKQYATLPNLKSEVQNVPFSQNTLRKTENSFSKPAPEKNIFENVVLRKTANNLPNKRHSMGPIIPPAPPQMPKIITATKKPGQKQISVEDPRDQLLESIRNFGGKNGLRAAK